MAGTKKIRYQWICHQLETTIRKQLKNRDFNLSDKNNLWWYYRALEDVIDILERIKHMEYERIFNEEEYENKIKRSDARKGH